MDKKQVAAIICLCTDTESRTRTSLMEHKLIGEMFFDEQNSLQVGSILNKQDDKGKKLKLEVIDIYLEFLHKVNENDKGVVFSHAGEQYPYNFIVKIITKEI